MLLEFVTTVDRDTRRRRLIKDVVPDFAKAGWNDLEIAEAVYVTALFAFFNRVADAFGLDNPGH